MSTERTLWTVVSAPWRLKYLATIVCNLIMDENKLLVLSCPGGAQLGVWISWPGAWKSEPRRGCQPRGKTGENAFLHCGVGRGKKRFFQMCLAYYQIFNTIWNIKGWSISPFTVTLHAFLLSNFLKPACVSKWTIPAGASQKLCTHRSELLQFFLPLKSAQLLQCRRSPVPI